MFAGMIGVTTFDLIFTPVFYGLTSRLARLLRQALPQAAAAAYTAAHAAE